MSKKTIEQVAKADVVKRVVARSIKQMAWRTACEQECLAYASKGEREAVEAYVRAEYDEADAGFSGRWQ